jgi:hypothetical protein
MLATLGMLLALGRFVWIIIVVIVVVIVLGFLFGRR